MKSDLTKLEETMLACDKNIKTFEDAIAKERGTIKEWESFIDNPNSSFPKESLERGINKCKENITTFNEAIDKEYETKDECRFQIDVIKENDHVKKLKEDGITIDAKDIK